MSRYDEIKEAAATAQKNLANRRDRCWGYMAAAVNGFAKYCEIPTDPAHITFLLWNEEEERYVEAENGRKYTLLGATVFHDGDGFWRLGICITLPGTWVSFSLCVAEQDGHGLVKIGHNGKPRQIDFTDPIQCNAFYEEIVGLIKKSFEDSKKVATTPGIGFHVPNT